MKKKNILKKSLMSIFFSKPINKLNQAKITLNYKFLITLINCMHVMSPNVEINMVDEIYM